MRRNDRRLLWGALLVLMGFVFLLQNLGLFDLMGLIPESLWSVFWTFAFAGAGLLFLAGLWQRPENWWMAIPGCTLLGLSGTILSEEILTGFPFGGSIFLGSVGAGFVVVYLREREHWWAVIPAGVLTTLAVVAGLDEVTGWDNGGVFFLGLGLTFAVVALVPTAKGRMTWAWIPAGVLLLLALITSASLEGIFDILWPLALVVLGGAILYRNYLRRAGNGDGL